MIVLGIVDVAGDGDCLFHAVGFHDSQDGRTLRIEIARFMEREALNQEDGFQGAWLDEAEELLRGRWGGHTALTAYSLLRKAKMEVHILQLSGSVLIKDATHPDVAGIDTAPVIRVFYNGLDHYQALVQLGPNPDGWEAAWEQPPPEIYFKETKKGAKPAFPSLADAAKVGNPRKAADFDQPRPSKKSKQSQKAGKKGKKKEDAGVPAGPAEPKPHPITDCRITTKTTPPPELRDDIMTDLAVYGVRPKTAHPHRKQEDLIKAGARKVCQCEKISSDVNLFRGALLFISNCLVASRSYFLPRCRNWL